MAVVLANGVVAVTAVWKVAIFPTDVAVDVVKAVGVDIVVSYVIVTGTRTLGVAVSVVMI